MLFFNCYALLVASYSKLPIALEEFAAILLSCYVTLKLPIPIYVFHASNIMLYTVPMLCQLATMLVALLEGVLKLSEA
ncbi:MAG TPA: hypothetical protein GXX75_20050 [Clostridiales bacterium]|nr:hypothetical protein [Clostridiales bacterium]